MCTNIEIIDFLRPDASRKNLFISNIPGSLSENDIVYELTQKFEPFGLLNRVQVFPTQWQPESGQQHDQDSKETTGGFYAFVTYYSVAAAAAAKDELTGSLVLGDNECKIAFSKRKKAVTERPVLYITKCYELINHYLGFNSWKSAIKTVFEDTESREEAEHTVTVRYVSLVELSVLDLHTDGIGIAQETWVKVDPLSKIQAVCKCKKISHHRALENAFSKVLLIVLGNGKVSVEIDTTKPEFNSDFIPDDQLVKVNNLDDKPESEEMKEEAEQDEGSLSVSNMDDFNLHILQELEEEM